MSRRTDDPFVNFLANCWLFLFWLTINAFMAPPILWVWFLWLRYWGIMP